MKVKLLKVWEALKHSS